MASNRAFIMKSIERIPENIALIYEHKDGLASRRAILSHFRRIDESHLYPVRGKFNATNRAIARLKRFEKRSGFYLLGLELCLELDHILSDIINDPNL